MVGRRKKSILEREIKPDDVVTAEELGVLLQTSSTNIYNYTKKGIISTYKSPLEDNESHKYKIKDVFDALDKFKLKELPPYAKRLGKADNIYISTYKKQLAKLYWYNPESFIKTSTFIKLFQLDYTHCCTVLFRLMLQKDFPYPYRFSNLPGNPRFFRVREIQDWMRKNGIPEGKKNVELLDKDGLCDLFNISDQSIQGNLLRISSFPKSTVSNGTRCWNKAEIVAWFNKERKSQASQDYFDHQIEIAKRKTKPILCYDFSWKRCLEHSTFVNFAWVGSHLYIDYSDLAELITFYDFPIPAKTESMVIFDAQEIFEWFKKEYPKYLKDKKVSEDVLQDLHQSYEEFQENLMKEEEARRAAKREEKRKLKAQQEVKQEVNPDPVPEVKPNPVSEIKPDPEVKHAPIPEIKPVPLPKQRTFWQWLKELFS